MSLRLFDLLEFLRKVLLSLPVAVGTKEFQVILVDADLRIGKFIEEYLKVVLEFDDRNIGRHVVQGRLRIEPLRRDRIQFPDPLESFYYALQRLSEFLCGSREPVAGDQVHAFTDQGALNIPVFVSVLTGLSFVDLFEKAFPGTRRADPVRLQVPQDPEIRLRVFRRYMKSFRDMLRGHRQIPFAVDRGDHVIKDLHLLR